MIGGCLALRNFVGHCGVVCEEAFDFFVEEADDISSFQDASRAGRYIGGEGDNTPRRENWAAVDFGARWLHGAV